MGLSATCCMCSVLCLFSFQLFYTLNTLSHLCFCVCFLNLFSVLFTLMFAFVLFSVYVYAVMSSIFVSVLFLHE